MTKIFILANEEPFRVSIKYCSGILSAQLSASSPNWTGVLKFRIDCPEYLENEKHGHDKLS